MWVFCSSFLWCSNFSVSFCAICRCSVASLSLKLVPRSAAYCAYSSCLLMEVVQALHSCLCAMFSSVQPRYRISQSVCEMLSMTSSISVGFGRECCIMFLRSFGSLLVWSNLSGLRMGVSSGFFGSPCNSSSVIVICCAVLICIVCRSWIAASLIAICCAIAMIS